MLRAGSTSKRASKLDLFSVECVCLTPSVKPKGETAMCWGFLFFFLPFFFPVKARLFYEWIPSLVLFADNVELDVHTFVTGQMTRGITGCNRGKLITETKHLGCKVQLEKSAEGTDRQADRQPDD